MLGVLVERKKVSDLVGRSSKLDHVKQLRKMRLASETCPTQLVIIEGDPKTAQYNTYVQSLPLAIFCDDHMGYWSRCHGLESVATISKA